MDASFPVIVKWDKEKKLQKQNQKHRKMKCPEFEWERKCFISKHKL